MLSGGSRGPRKMAVEPAGRQLGRTLQRAGPRQALPDTASQQCNVEVITTVMDLARRQRIEKQRGQRVPSQDLGDLLVAQARIAAPAAMCKEHESLGIGRDALVTWQAERPDLNGLTNLIHFSAPGLSVQPRSCVDGRVAD